MTMKWCRSDANDRFIRRQGMAACVACIVMGASLAACSAPPTTPSTPAGEVGAAPTLPDSAQVPPTQEPTGNPTAVDAPTATEDASSFSEVIAGIRTAIGETMAETWTTQIVDDSRPEEVCEGRAHVNVVVPSQGSGAVRSVAQDQGAAVSVVARRYSSERAAAEALDYVAVTSTTDCNPLVVTEGFEDFFVAESVDQAQLDIVDEAEGWASYRRSVTDASDVRVAAYSASYRVGESLATIHARVELHEGEDPDDAVKRARELQATVVAPVVGVLESSR